MEVLKQFAELGAFGAVVPEKYEGAGNIFLQSDFFDFTPCRIKHGTAPN